MCARGEGSVSAHLVEEMGGEESVTCRCVCMVGKRGGECDLQVCGREERRGV